MPRSDSENDQVEPAQLLRVGHQVYGRDPSLHNADAERYPGLSSGCPPVGPDREGERDEYPGQTDTPWVGNFSTAPTRCAAIPHPPSPPSDPNGGDMSSNGNRDDEDQLATEHALADFRAATERTIGTWSDAKLNAVIVKLRHDSTRKPENVALLMFLEDARLRRHEMRSDSDGKGDRSLELSW